MYNYCQTAYYTATQTWQAWQPESSTIVQDDTLVSDAAISATSLSIIVLSSLEQFRADTVYVAAYEGPTMPENPVSYMRTCIPSSQKSVAIRQLAASDNAMVVWPSPGSQGILYIIS
jgi:hypothetical protein